MKIEIWSDFTCPYCFIGKKRLDIALEQFEHAHCVKIEYKSFELDPDVCSDCHVSKADMLMHKYNMTETQVNKMIEEITSQANAVGLNVSFNNLIHTNTFQAHRLAKFSDMNDDSINVMDSLFHSYFIKNENIGDQDILLRIAEESGLDKSKSEALLCLNKYAKAVREDQGLAEELGIGIVPFYIFNEKHAVAGVQSIEMFLSILMEVFKEEQDELENPDKPPSRKTYCTGNECELVD